MHLISAFFFFNVRIPKGFTNMFSVFNRMSSPDETFFSFDCFISDYEIKFFAPSNKLFKMFLYIFFPVLMILAIAVLFLMIKLVHIIVHSVRNKWKNSDQERRSLFDFKRSLIVSMICIIYLFHPTFTVKSLAMFLCTQVDDNDSRMTYHLDYSCYSSEHIKWVTFVSLPILAIWVIGLPLLVLVILIKNRKNLQEIHVKSYFLILYQGYKEERFYWEFLSAFRKFCILSIHSLLNNFSVSYKIFASVVFLVFFYYLQKGMKPYKDETNNSLDLKAITIATVTIFSGLIFSLGNEVHDGFYTVTMIIIVFFNGYFLLSWAY